MRVTYSMRNKWELGYIGGVAGFHSGNISKDIKSLKTKFSCLGFQSMNCCSKKKQTRVYWTRKDINLLIDLSLVVSFIFTQLAKHFFNERGEKKLVLLHNTSETSKSKVNIWNGCISRDKVNQGFSQSGERADLDCPWLHIPNGT